MSFANRLLSICHYEWCWDTTTGKTMLPRFTKSSRIARRQLIASYGYSYKKTWVIICFCLYLAFVSWIQHLFSSLFIEQRVTLSLKMDRTRSQVSQSKFMLLHQEPIPLSIWWFLLTLFGELLCPSQKPTIGGSTSNVVYCRESPEGSDLAIRWQSYGWCDSVAC